MEQITSVKCHQMIDKKSENILQLLGDVTNVI